MIVTSLPARGERVVELPATISSATLGERKRFSRARRSSCSIWSATRCSSFAFQSASCAAWSSTLRCSARMRSSDFTRASSSGWLIGLERKSSAPGLDALHALGLGIEGRTMTTGSSAVAGSARMRAAHLVAAHLRHDHVEQHEVGLGEHDLREPLLARGRGHHLVAGEEQHLLQQPHIGGRVVDDKDAGLLAHAFDLAADVLVDHLAEGGDIDRLGDVAVEARGDDAVALARRDRGGHGDHGNGRRFGVGAQPAQRRDAVHRRQLDVHEDKRRLVGSRELERGRAVLALDHLVAAELEDGAHQLAVALVVLDQQDSGCSWLSDRKVKVNVEPLPDALSPRALRRAAPPGAA